MRAKNPPLPNRKNLIPAIWELFAKKNIWGQKNLKDKKL